MILAASSTFFQHILKKTKHPHPLIYLRGMSNTQLRSVVDFIYHGEVKIYQEYLEDFLKIAEDLQLKGINESQTETEHKKDKMPRSSVQKLSTDLSKNALEMQDKNMFLQKKIF